MNGVEYTKKLNRQNEIYQKNLRDANRNHDETVKNIQKTADTKMKGMQEAHLKDKNKIEKEAASVIKGYRADQQKSLKDKSVAYEKEVEKNKNAFHKERKQNLEEWRGKFQNLQDTFNKNIEQKDISNAQAKNELSKNYQENLKNIRSKSKEDLDRFIANTASSSDSSAASYVKEKRDMQDANQKEKNDILQRNLREKHIFKNKVANEVQNMRENQRDEFIKQRDFSKARFEKLNTDLNAKQDAFQRGKIKDAEIAYQKANKQSNEDFADRFDKQSKRYNDELRGIETRQKMEKIANHNINKQIQEEQRANERANLDREKKLVINDKLENTKAYEKKFTDLTKSYQDSFKDMRLDFADKQVKKDRDITEQNRQKEIKDRMKTDKMMANHKIALDYSEERATDRLNTQSDLNKHQIQNLKENFNKGMELANLKARKDFEKNREETVKEKAELQKRLHEQNSKTNSYLKKIYGEKISKMEAGYEKRIMDLENQNKMIQENANDSLKQLSEASSIEIERQKEIAMKSAKEQVDTERQIASENDRTHRKKFARLQGEFTRRMNEQANSSRKRIKEVTRTLENEKLTQARKYQDILNQNKKYFEREVARITASSQAEKEALVVQYEDRIQQLSKLHNDKIKEMEEFDRLNNKA